MHRLANANSLGGVEQIPGVYAMVERASLNVIEVKLHTEKPQVYLAEWFLIRPYSLIWPETSETTTIINHNILIGSQPGGLDIRINSNPGDTISRDMVTLNVEGHRIYLREVQQPKSSKGPGCCMLIYCDKTTSEFRTKLQECISLTLGIHLVYLGNTAFSEDWDVTGLRAVRGYSINRRVFKLPPQPPSPLSAKSHQLLDGLSFNHHVSALCSNYNKLHLGHLCWVYWHALCAPAHVGAANYGAAIEALRRAFVESKPELRDTKIIAEPGKWREVAGALNDVLNNANFDKETLRMLCSKVSNLNSLPPARLTELVCEKIGVHLGEAENAAWERRNRAAHGSRINADEYVQVIRDIRLLNIVFNRMLLAMTGASQSYVDY